MRWGRPFWWRKASPPLSRWWACEENKVSKDTVSIGLSAAIVAVEGERPSVLVGAHDRAEDALPFGPFDPAQQRTLESGLRKWVGEQTKFDLGYTEQLYTFGDKGR